jgi:hypothetical protein
MTQLPSLCADDRLKSGQLDGTREDAQRLRVLAPESPAAAEAEALSRSLGTGQVTAPRPAGSP